MKDGSGRYRCLSAAGGAFIGEALGVERPGFCALAFRTDEAIRPAFFEEVAGAGRIVWKPRGEGGSRHRAVVFPAARHKNECRTFDAAVNPAWRYL
jgi:hypothetical protein